MLRSLWCEKTGYVQIIEPKTLVPHAKKLYHYIWGPLDRGVDTTKEMKKNLKLKYDRKTCLRVARWMDSAHPKKISESNGVAYDPSCVQHMVRISEGNLSKGLISGVLDVSKREIVSTSGHLIQLM